MAVRIQGLPSSTPPVPDVARVPHYSWYVLFVDAVFVRQLAHGGLAAVHVVYERRPLYGRLRVHGDGVDEVPKETKWSWNELAMAMRCVRSLEWRAASSSISAIVIVSPRDL